jgi:hypothetical protein
MRTFSMTKPMRARTGKIQFENDWPGVFIRGDDALSYARAIHKLLAAGMPHDLSDDEMNKWSLCREALLELAELLESCRVAQTTNA